MLIQYCTQLEDPVSERETQTILGWEYLLPLRQRVAEVLFLGREYVFLILK